LLLAFFRLSLLPSSSILSNCTTCVRAGQAGAVATSDNSTSGSPGHESVCVCVAVCKVGHVQQPLPHWPSCSVTPCRLRLVCVVRGAAANKCGTQHASDKYWQVFERAVS
jgi:hypothetical protein